MGRLLLFVCLCMGVAAPGRNQNHAGEPQTDVEIPIEFTEYERFAGPSEVPKNNQPANPDPLRVNSTDLAKYSRKDLERLKAQIAQIMVSGRTREDRQAASDLMPKIERALSKLYANDRVQRLAPYSGLALTLPLINPDSSQFMRGVLELSE